LEKFKRLGIDATVDEIFGSAYAAAYALKYRYQFPAKQRVYVVGQSGICDELDEQGIAWCGGQVRYMDDTTFYTCYSTYHVVHGRCYVVFVLYI
jgi:ribonucleotide monophosphatase NagD (HAD superfamily)